MNTTTTKQPEQKTMLLSKKGMKELRKSIAQLEVDRSAISRSLRESEKTTGHDDRFERNELLLRMEALDAELYDKQQILNHAKLIPTRRARMKVAIGSVVDLIDQKGRLFRYTLVESVEADPSDGRISALSPLGSSLLGKSAHDTVELQNGLRNSTFKLVRIT